MYIWAYIFWMLRIALLSSVRISNRRPWFSYESNNLSIGHTCMKFMPHKHFLGAKKKTTSTESLTDRNDVYSKVLYLQIAKIRSWYSVKGHGVVFSWWISQIRNTTPHLPFKNWFRFGRSYFKLLFIASNSK